MAKKDQPKQEGDGQEGEPIPFDEALRRLVNTPPKPKKGDGGARDNADEDKR